MKIEVTFDELNNFRTEILNQVLAKLDKQHSWNDGSEDYDRAVTEAMRVVSRMILREGI